MIPVLFMFRKNIDLPNMSKKCIEGLEVVRMSERTASNIDELYIKGSKVASWHFSIVLCYSGVSLLI
jgi:hypothetical protein